MRAVLLLLVPSIAVASPPTIKPAEIEGVVAKAIANADPKAPLGTSVVIAKLEKLDVAREAKALRDKLAGTIVDDRDDGGATVLVVEGANKARVVIALAPEHGGIAVVAKPVVKKLAGACVAIPKVAPIEVDVNSSGVNHDGELTHGSSFWRMDTGRFIDVDGDAIGDMLVPIPPKTGVCPEDFTYRVYAMRGSCGHDLGVVGPGNFQWDAATVPLDASGFRPITMEQRKARRGARGIPEMTTKLRVFAVKGKAYAGKLVNDSTGTCHHCGVWHCTKR
jgi:hypothetical protein